MIKTMEIFNEETLAKEIAKIWGEHGAHADLFRTILNSLKVKDKELERLERIKDLLEKTIKTQEETIAILKPLVPR